MLLLSNTLSGAAAVKSGAGSPLRAGPGTGQQPVQVVIKDSPIILAQVINSLVISHQCHSANPRDLVTLKKKAQLGIVQ